MPTRRIAVAALAVLAVLGLAGPAAAARPAVRVLTFNICGNVCRGGEVRATSANLAFQISSRRVDIAFLQEMCYSQFLAARNRLWPLGYRAVFTATDTGGRCNDHDRTHGKAFGIAVVVKGAVVGRNVIRLPSLPSARREGRSVLGTTVRLRGRAVYAVTTHIAPGGPDRGVQLATLRDYLTPIARRRPVILGGDLNTLPDHADLDAFYGPPAPGGRGAFREADDTRSRPYCRCGRPTYTPVPRKIDYVFASRRFFTPRAAATAGTRYSDHRIYVGTFSMH